MPTRDEELNLTKERFILDEEFLDSLSWCDLITEDELSDDLPRCDGYSNECIGCETKRFLDAIDYKELLREYKELLREYSGRMRYNLKKWCWGRRGKKILPEKLNLLSD